MSYSSLWVLVSLTAIFVMLVFNSRGIRSVENAQRAFPISVSSSAKSLRFPASNDTLLSLIVLCAFLFVGEAFFFVHNFRVFEERSTFYVVFQTISSALVMVVCLLQMRSFSYWYQYNQSVHSLEVYQGFLQQLLNESRKQEEQ